MEAHRIMTRFGPVDGRASRLHGGWWLVLVGRHDVPREPSLDGPLPQSVGDALTRVAQAVDRLSVPVPHRPLASASRGAA